MKGHINRELIKQTLTTPGGQEIMVFLKAKVLELQNVNQIKDFGGDIGMAALGLYFAQEKLQEVVDEIEKEESSGDTPEDSLVVR